jgi:RNA polymerase sigma-70 factor (ECF subfamily)
MPAPSLESAPDLLAAAEARRPAASLDALLAAHGERAIRVASRFVRGDRAAAEDIAQEAFAKAWRALPRFRGEAELATWLYRVVVNESLSHLRRRRVRESLLERFALARPAAAPRPPDPTLRARIEAALGALSANERATFVLVHLEGFTLEDAARILERRVGTIKSQLHRALVKLRRELASCWEEQR